MRRREEVVGVGDGITLITLIADGAHPLITFFTLITVIRAISPDSAIGAVGA